MPAKTWEEIEGWFTPAEAQAMRDVLSSLAVRPVVVELGSYMGRSTLVIAQHLIDSCGRPNEHTDAPKFYAVDRWLRTPGVCPGFELGGGKCEPGMDYMAPFIDNMREFGVLDFVQPLRLLTVEAARLFADVSVDVIFHDASHDGESVLRDLNAWVPKLRIGGFWTLHDHHQPGGRELDACRLLKQDRIVDSLWIGRRVF
jgi:hypothetical protein